MAIEHSHTHPPEPPVSPPGVPPDPAQESLVRALRASFNILRVLMIVLVVLYVFSGVFRVEPWQQGLVARLGKLRENPEAVGTYVFKPGWYFRMLPEPFDKQFKISGQVQTLPVTTFMFAHPRAETAKNLAEITAAKEELEPGVDGAMFTGDKNLSHGRWEVQYKIGDVAKFVQNVGETPEDGRTLLQRLTETAVMREVAGRTIEEVTRTALDEVRERVKTRLQKSLDDLGTGIVVADVLANTIEPGAVREAFMDVSRAEQERLALERAADEKRVEILSHAAGDPKEYTSLLEAIGEYGAAQMHSADDAELTQLLGRIETRLLDAETHEAGQVAVKLREARGEAGAAVDKLRTEYEDFTTRLAQRTARPRITILGLWTEMRSEILGTLANEIFVVPQSDQIEILVNRNPERQKALDEQQTFMRQGRLPPGPPPQ
jgi:regulator of protease activity HflC (stomatin/prohibitin superfamily)